MSRWYENKQSNLFGEQCDDALDNQDCETLLKLVEKAWQLGHNTDEQTILRARYLYDGFTCLSNWISISSHRQHNSNKSYVHYEREHEKCLYLCRQAIKLAETFRDNELDADDKMEVKYFHGFHCQLLVNYANLLSQTGRLISAIYVLTPIAKDGFGMAAGCLGLNLFDYVSSDYDNSHRVLLAREAYPYLLAGIKNSQVYKEARQTFQSYKERIEQGLSIEMLSEQHNYEKNMPNDTSGDELLYRKWCAENCLSLNTLNDAYYGVGVAYDPLHLPSMVVSVSDGIIPRYHGLFNQIKQEYVSARYLAYDGLINRETHYFDKNVYMVNTLDYPVYGLGLEKIKAAFRAIYSVFDRIAYFLNYYFELDIDDNRISYKRIWSDPRQKLEKICSTNYPLLGLKWVCKDISNKSITGYKQHIDPLMAKVSEVRNAMEHRYFKVLDWADENQERLDKLAYTISFDIFEKLTISLLRYAREAIILLIKAVFVEEYNRRKDMGDRIIMPMHTSPYEDEWKQIFW